MTSPWFPKRRWPESQGGVWGAGVKWSHESEPEGKLEGPFKGELISCLWADFEK